jgi:hypothetical protein
MTKKATNKRQMRVQSLPSNDEPTTENAPKLSITRIIMIVLVVIIAVNIILLLVRGGDEQEVVTEGTASIVGTIINTDGAPIADAIIFIEGMLTSVTTDARGDFLIDNAPVGNVQLVIGVTPMPPQFQGLVTQDNQTTDVGTITYRFNEES